MKLKPHWPITACRYTNGPKSRVEPIRADPSLCARLEDIIDFVENDCYFQLLMQNRQWPSRQQLNHREP